MSSPARPPDPLVDPRASAAAVLAEWRGLADLTEEEFAARCRQVPGLGYVTEGMVREMERTGCGLTLGLALVALHMAGRSGLVILTRMLQLD